MQNWYYGQGNQQVGPVTKEVLMEMLQQQVLSPETLLWSEGMSNWMLAKEIFPGLVPLHPSSFNLPAHPAPVILTKTSIFIPLLMTKLSWGFYPLGWLFQRRNEFNSLNTTVKLREGFLAITLTTNLIAVGAILLSRLLEEPGPNGDNVSVISDMLSFLGGLMSLAFWIMFILQAFKVRKMLQEHFNGYLQRNVKFSGIMTFFFHIIYLQYKINRLE
jgi:hypothetical protein